MIYIERTQEGVLRLVVECEHPGEREIASAALDCLTWVPKVQADPDYQRAMNLADGKGELEPGERIDILRFHDKDSGEKNGD